MSTDSHDKDHDHDRSYENESTRDHSPMVQISLKEYDKLKEKQHFITDKAMIDTNETAMIEDFLGFTIKLTYY